MQEPFKASAIINTSHNTHTPFREFLQLSQSGLIVPPPLEHSLFSPGLTEPPIVKAKPEEPAEHLCD